MSFCSKRGGVGLEYSWYMMKDEKIVSGETRKRFRGQTCFLWNYTVWYSLRDIAGAVNDILEYDCIGFHWLHVPSEDDVPAFRQTSSVLQNWGLPAEVAHDLVLDVESFTHEMMKNMVLEDNIIDDHDYGKIVPIDVTVTITTVQKEGESMDSVRERAIIRKELGWLFDSAVRGVHHKLQPRVLDRWWSQIDGVSPFYVKHGLSDECVICSKESRDGDVMCHSVILGASTQSYHIDCILGWLQNPKNHLISPVCPKLDWKTINKA